MNKSDEKGRQGYWEERHEESTDSGYYVDDKRSGLWQFDYFNDNKIESIEYVNGMRHGKYEVKVGGQLIESGEYLFDGKNSIRNNLWYDVDRHTIQFKFK